MTHATLLLALALTSTSTLSDDQIIERVIAGRGELASLRDVQRAAVDALGVVSDDDASSWHSRARWRGVVPRVDVGAGTYDGLDVRTMLYGASAYSTTDLYKLGLDVRARWELGELVFNDMELRANRESLARSAAIHLARERATRLYFERVEVLMKQRHDPSPVLTLAAARLDGLLRAVTGGILDRERKDKGR
jgi:hypothetical protein